MWNLTNSTAYQSSVTGSSYVNHYYDNTRHISAYASFTKVSLGQTCGYVFTQTLIFPNPNQVVTTKSRKVKRSGSKLALCLYQNCSICFMGQLIPPTKKIHRNPSIHRIERQRYLLHPYVTLKVHTTFHPNPLKKFYESWL